MGLVESYIDREYQLYVPGSEDRAPGFHVSGITKALLRQRYPHWFKDYDDSDKTLKSIRIFEKGHIVEEAWGDAMARMVPFFDKPEPRYVSPQGEWANVGPYGQKFADEHPGGIWMSPDGYAPSQSDTTVGHWPAEYPPLTLPAIFECKAGLKSCHPTKSPITHEKFLGWLWNVMAYCYGWETEDAYLMTHHFQGDYTGFPPEPQLLVHHFHWDMETLEDHWEKLVEYAQEHPELKEG